MAEAMSNQETYANSLDRLISPLVERITVGDIIEASFSDESKSVYEFDNPDVSNPYTIEVVQEVDDEGGLWTKTVNVDGELVYERGRYEHGRPERTRVCRPGEWCEAIAEIVLEDEKINSVDEVVEAVIKETERARNFLPLSDLD